MDDNIEKQSSDLSYSPAQTPGAAPDGIGREDYTDRPKKARRTFLTQNACTRCRQKKSKCDGKRPICGRCEKHGADCVYDVAQEGITRMQNLQNQLDTRNEDYSKLDDLLGALRLGTDHEATTILARLRLGASIDDLLCYVALASGTRNGPSQAQMQQPPGYMQSWPPSPLDGQSWTTWSARCDPEDSSLSQSLESGLEELRTGPSGPRPDAKPTMRDRFGANEGRDDFRQKEPRDGYYGEMPRDGFPRGEQGYAFSPDQWQSPQSPEESNDESPVASTHRGPYYGEQQQQQQSSSRQEVRGQQQNAQTGDKRQASSHGRQGSR